MKTKKNKKSGFTLVELMVVAIIVAILAAVAIPLMSGNKERAMATEGQTGCGAIANAVRMHFIESSKVPTDVFALPGIKAGDLDGTYFQDGSYKISVTDAKNYTVTADGIGDADTVKVTMTVKDGKATFETTADGEVTVSGS